jgi:quinol monooxygenase YgiN
VDKRGVPVLLAIKAVWSTIAADMPKHKSHKSSRRPGRRRTHAAAITKLPKNAVTRVVTLRAKEGQHMLLEAELRALIAPSRKEEGCLRFDLHGCVDQPGTFLLHEVWGARENHTAHTRTPHFLRWNARKDALLAFREAAFWHQLA